MLENAERFARMDLECRINSAIQMDDADGDFIGEVDEARYSIKPRALNVVA